MRARVIILLGLLALLGLPMCSSDDEGAGSSNSRADGGVIGGGEGGLTDLEQPTTGGESGNLGGKTSLGGDTAGSTGGAGGAPCVNSLPLTQTAPPTLEETGFYEDPDKKTIAAALRPFEPRFKLWSDGADKTRWLYLPECDGVINTEEMDHWRFPVGTYSFKRFVVDGALVETRLIHKYGPEDQEVLYATYVWDEEQQLSVLDNNGHSVPRDGGGTYDVPNVAAGHCSRCHGPNETMSVGQPHGLPSRFLGLNAVDLSHDGGGLTLSELRESGLLSAPPASDFEAPGDPVVQAALGYLHANCGYCHNEGPLGYPIATDYFLRLRSSDSTVEETGAYTTAVNVPVAQYSSLESEPCTHRIHGGNVGLSCIHERMSLRPTNQMPPLDTNLADTAGLLAIETWIESLSPPN